MLSERLAFRGGTALHKLFITPQSRYSEDIDLVQIKSAPFGEILDRLREVLSFIPGKASVDTGDMITMSYKFISEIPPTASLKLKVETNCREHFSELGWEKMDYVVKSDWFEGECQITTFKLEELLGTKLRALYQRRKGRDLYDLFKVLNEKKIDAELVIKCFKKYMEFSVGKAPSQKEFMDNLDDKMKNDNFIGDIKALLHPSEKYEQSQGYELVKEKIIKLL
jgi:predicted nucleotidyltransferase component of viral defense system